MSDRYRNRRGDSSRSRSRDRDRFDRSGRERYDDNRHRHDDGGFDRDRGRDRDSGRRREGNDIGVERSRDRHDRNRDRDRYSRPHRSRSRSRSPGGGGGAGARRSRSPDRRRSDIQQQREQKILAGMNGRNQAAATESRLAMVKTLTGTGAEDDEEDGAITVGPDGRQESVHVVGGTSEEDIMAMMGFSGFGSTKGQQVECNQNTSAVGTVSKHKKRVYRQYMNRRGGFNRPLQKMN